MRHGWGTQNAIRVLCNDGILVLDSSNGTRVDRSSESRVEGCMVSDDATVQQ